MSTPAPASLIAQLSPAALRALERFTTACEEKREAENWRRLCESNAWANWCTETQDALVIACDLAECAKELMVEAWEQLRDRVGVDRLAELRLNFQPQDAA